MENLNSYIKEHFTDSILVKEQILKDENLITLIKNASLEVIKAYRNGNKTLLAGNGGSAADAQHIAGEFVSRFYFDRPGIASIALTTDTSILTAIGNDYGYENLFARQVQAQGVKGDVFIGISTSGNSKNILKALELCDYCIKVPSTCTPRIQEAHILIGHIICAIIEEELFGKGFSCKQ
ncbi:D-sedoheptulose 7-phosphate isomerase [Campylobacter jejuni]|nr:D-sedoheptulose 7-phosphate isomerase [Campylobacter jejuni]EAI5580373.1 D-sedoheptulose 7-phosphate isomerase [Campylobacter jejuni]EAI5821395.1 D-sedoheptulose 7-phosphate isomerase [Campylobacter jejuni]EAJ1780920.1 D-sedoheptulose 7-phosphate isomerase [Campylobacter jejuni]EAK6725468.1 D-sedoheptulose 7-phosphate isomerase [Campylobacter jejuni]